MTFAGIALIEAEGVVTFQCEPAIERLIVDAAALRELLTLAGYGEWLVQSDTLDKAVADCNKQEKPFTVALAQRKDSQVTIEVDADEMVAKLTLTPPHGGETASEATILQALDAAGVVFGIDESAIRQACEAGQCEGITVAQGQPVQHGCDTEFEVMIEETVSRAPQLDAQGLIDYREHGCITVVQPGAALMRRTPAGTGVAGRTVRGVVVVPQPGSDAPFAAKLEGARPASDDPNLLEATIAGQPVRVDCGVKVEPVFQVAEVNMASGNIHFDGTVHVRGDVTQGMKVEASGDIVVDGMVEGGVLQAGGDIRVAGGVIAHAWLHAGVCVSARFAEGAHISAGSTIMIGDMALECELESLNQIVIGAASPKRGRLVGGSAITMMLSVPILGSSSGGLTRVTVGVNSELDAQLAELVQRIEKEQAAEKELEKLVSQLTRMGDPKKMLGRVKETRQHALDVLGASLVERAELQAQIQQVSLAKITVSVGVAGAVDLTMGKLMAKLCGDSDAGVFSADLAAAHITFTDRHGGSIPATWLGSKPASMMGSA